MPRSYASSRRVGHRARRSGNGDGGYGEPRVRADCSSPGLEDAEARTQACAGVLLDADRAAGGRALGRVDRIGLPRHAFAAEPERDSSRSGAAAQGLEEPVEIGPHGMRRKVQLGTDLFVGETKRNQTDDL